MKDFDLNTNVKVVVDICNIELRAKPSVFLSELTKCERKEPIYTI